MTYHAPAADRRSILLGGRTQGNGAPYLQAPLAGVPASAPWC